MKDSKQIHYIFLALVLLLGIYGSYQNYKILQEDTTPFIYDILTASLRFAVNYR